MRLLICILILCPFLRGETGDMGLEDELASLTDVYAVEDALGAEERQICGELALDGSYDVKGAVERLWTSFRDAIVQRVENRARFVTMLLGVEIACALGLALCPEKKAAQMIQLAGCCVAGTVLAGGTESAIGDAIAALDELAAYSKVALPVFFTAAATSGAAVSSSARYAAVCLAADVYMGLTGALIMPLIRAFLALSVSAALFGAPLLRSAARAAKWCIVTLMTATTLAFSVFLSLSGALTGSADALAVKTTRTVISTALPVIGGTISDLSASLLSAAALIRDTLGAAILIGICAICIAPFALLLVEHLSLKVAAAAAEMLCPGGLSCMLGDVGTGFGMLLGLVGSYSILLFLSIVSGLRAVVP
ncbi:MAG: hypothetical protein IK095_06135 [Oscillospiraceae bacterium]|nr:hypothetical protein [Oscillospiraceae bacterium]